MSKQIQIIEKTPLLDENGNLFRPGYCTRNLYIYNREKISAKHRIKEWDFYQIGDERYMLQLCFADISIGAAGNATLLDLATGEKFTSQGLVLFPSGKYPLPKNGDESHNFSFIKGNFSMSFRVGEESRVLKFNGKSKGSPFYGEILLEYGKEDESLTIATPFEKKGRFFLTQKKNCMTATGKVVAGGREYEFSPKYGSFGVLDWGRGVWPHKNLWYWANGSTFLDGELFGFELTWGFGVEDYATETALFYKGKCHKLGRVWLERSPKGRWTEPWVFKEENVRFNLTMTPFYDHVTGIKIPPLVGARCHQVHGKWNGTVVLDDGEVLEIKDMYAFCERMENLW